MGWIRIDAFKLHYPTRKGADVRRVYFFSPGQVFHWEKVGRTTLGREANDGGLSRPTGAPSTFMVSGFQSVLQSWCAF